MPTVVFSTELSAPASPMGDMVLRRGKVFECGVFEDKDFSLTPDEARAACAAFQPCNADLEHRPSILDSHLGGLVGVEMGADGKTLFGTVAEPKWLSDVLGNDPRKVSLTWDKETKQIRGIAHVLNPRIKDAAVFNAYAAFSGDASFRFETQAELDNIAEEDFGDVANKLFPARTQDEFRDSMRELANAADPSAVKKRLLKIAEAKGYKTETPWYQTPGISKPLGSDCLSCYSAENPTMKFFTRNPNGDMYPADVAGIVAFTKGTVSSETKDIFVQEEGGAPKLATPEQVVAFTAGKVTFAHSAATISPEIQARLDRLAQFEANEQVNFAATIATKAKAHYEALLKDNKTTPSEMETVVAAFTVAEQFDAKKKELAYFAEGDAGTANFSMSAFLRGEVEKRIPHNLTKEQVGALGKDGLAVFDQEQTTATGADGKTTTTLADGIFAVAARVTAAEGK